MPNLKRLLVGAAVTAALVGLSVPAGADPAAPPLKGPVAGEGWGPLVPVPIPKRLLQIEATAISDLGHIAVVYKVFPRPTDVRRLPGFVVVRSPSGVWSAPHRLNPRLTVLRSVDLAFDARGNLTAFWSFLAGVEEDGDPPPVLKYAVATKPAHRAWKRHVRVGPAQHVDFEQDVVLSVAPSGMAVIGWRQFVEPLDEFQFTVRVRRSAGGVWGPARALSAASNRDVAGDVAINDHGTATAAWTACRPWPARTCYVQRSRLTRSGVWTAPVTTDRRVVKHWVGKGFASELGSPIEVASTPAGFTAITWVRRHNDKWQTVVDLRTAAGIWSRHVVAGVHDRVAVGPHGTVVMIKNVLLPTREIRARAVTWRTNRSDWTTTRVTPRANNVWVLTSASDSSGRLFVPWTQWRADEDDLLGEQGFMSTHLRAWRTTVLWDWAPRTDFEAAAVSWNGRALAIRTMHNLRATTTAVQMRVLRPG